MGIGESCWLIQFGVESKDQFEYGKMRRLRDEGQEVGGQNHFFGKWRVWWFLHED